MAQRDGGAEVKECEACGEQVASWWGRFVWHLGCTYADSIRSAWEVNDLFDQGSPR